MFVNPVFWYVQLTLSMGVSNNHCKIERANCGIELRSPDDPIYAIQGVKLRPNVKAHYLTGL